MTTRRINALLSLTVVALCFVCGMLFMFYVDERDARIRAEADAVGLSDFVTDMLQFQADQIEARTFRLELIMEHHDEREQP